MILRDLDTPLPNFQQVNAPQCIFADTIQALINHGGCEL